MRTKRVRPIALPIALILSASLLAGCAPQEDAGLVIYSGRSESLISPFLNEFTALTGIKPDVRYGDSAALAAQLLEEGHNSPADLFISQDAGALGAISEAGLFATLDDAILNRVEEKFRSSRLDWVGISGRVRVLAYSPERVKNLPTSIDQLTSPDYRGRIGIAPTNASFQAFITALILSRGESAAGNWLEKLKANAVKLYERNSQIVAAIDAGEIDLGLVNHYYIWEVSKALGREIAVANGFFAPGDTGNMINVAGVGILSTSSKKGSASELLAFLLSEAVQRGFLEDTHEYSLVLKDANPQGLPPLSQIPAPRVDLSLLANLSKTQALLMKVGLI
ncbi:MAG: iron ABC transporter substrate-binding protein [Actinobacteria bacterium]|nr:iron ABC transporter substrate-binding protein [Actinomycetota bacterium]